MYEPPIGAAFSNWKVVDPQGVYVSTPNTPADDDVVIFNGAKNNENCVVDEDVQITKLEVTGGYTGIIGLWHDVTLRDPTKGSASLLDSPGKMYGAGGALILEGVQPLSGGTALLTT